MRTPTWSVPATTVARVSPDSPGWGPYTAEEAVQVAPLFLCSCSDVYQRRFATLPMVVDSLRFSVPAPTQYPTDDGGSSMVGPQFDQPERSPTEGAQRLRALAQGSYLDDIRFLWRRSWPRNRISRSRPHPVATSTIGSAAKLGARSTEYRQIPRPERPLSGRTPADQTSGWPWATPIDGILQGPTP